MTSRGRWLIPLMALLVGCASDPPSLTPVQAPHRPLAFTGFAISPPRADGWYFAQRDPVLGVSFVKPLTPPRPTPSFVVIAEVFYPAEGPVADLRAFAERLAPKTEGRHTVIETRVAPAHLLQADCARAEFVAEERDNPHLPGIVLVTTGTNLWCRHPESPPYLVRLGYSERRPKGTPSRLDDTLRREAEGVWTSITFFPLPRPRLPDTHVVPPAPSMPKDRAALSGRWAGTFDNGVQVLLVVEEVRAEDAVLVFAGGGLVPEPFWVRVTAVFRQDTLVYQSPGGTTTVYGLQPDGTLLATVTEPQGKTFRATFTRAIE